jgi:predicted DNA-binding transcriptional regulator YafY
VHGWQKVRRTDRPFDIIQTLRVAKQPITAATLAERLEVAVRTVYRDIATLQARLIPVEGAAGIGYVLRRGFDLPPLMFTADEVDAIAVGARLVRRLRDPDLQDAADSVLAKIATILPDPLRSGVVSAPFFVSDGDAATPQGINLSDVRYAIRETQEDAPHLCRRARSAHQPNDMPDRGGLLCGRHIAWCELRLDYRHFRVERIVTSTLLDATFPTAGGKLVEGWLAQRAIEEVDGSAD